jgi:hypothetical protein
MAVYTSCPGALPSIVEPGMEAMVATDDPTPVNVRVGAGRQYNEIGELQSGDRIRVLEGPTCVNGIAWFRISGRVEGWIAQGVESYFITPVISNSAARTGAALPGGRFLQPFCKGLIAEDEFTGGLSSHDWFQDATTDSQSAEQIIPDYYELRVRAIGAGLQNATTWGSLRGIDLTDARVEAVIKVEKFSDETNRTGLWLRYQDAENFMAFFIRNNGTYYVGRYQDNQYNDLVPYTGSTAINTGDGAVNTMRVDMQGSRYDFYVNGVFLTSVDDPAWASGRVAFFGSSRVPPNSFLLDYIRICEL